MNKIRSYFFKILKSRSTYFLAVTVVLNIVALILYVNTGISAFVPKLSAAVIAYMAAGIVLPFAVAFSPFKLPYAAVYFIDLFACFGFLASQASFIANVFVGIDGSSFSVAFCCVAVFTLAAAVLSLVAMTFVREEFPCLTEKEETHDEI